MGVTGLWKLIDASGKPVALETLENKVLAIDISIWLHQVVKGYQDNKGGTLANAHLIGLFNRICKLLFFRIKPVFIFDGGVPNLKRETIAKRLQSRSKIQNEADKFEQLLLESLAKEKIVQQALGGAVSQLLSPQKKYGKPKKDEPVDMFKLPPLKEEHIDANIKNEEEDSPKNAYDVNINTIDVTSSHFKSLPPDIRHDILTDIKETRKQNTWGRLRELPVEGNDFSTYQMSRLIRRRQVQTSLEDAEKEMGGKTWSLSELESLLSEDGVIQAASTNHAQRIASDEQTRFLLVRNVSKAIEDAKNIKTEEAAPEIPKLSPHPSTSKESISSPTDELEDEFDLDVQRAIQMSLGGNDIDQEFLDDNKTCTRIKLNPKQRQALSGTLQTHGLVRGFMMEYAEMNDTDIHELFDVTQDSKEAEVVDEYRAQFPNNDEYVLYGTPEKSKPIQIEKHKDTVEIGVISDSDSDSDLEEVPSGKSKPIQVQKDAAKIGVMSDSDSDSDLEEVSNGNSMKVLENDSKICVEITVASDLKNYVQEEDLFADVFKSDAVPKNSVCDSSLDIVDTDNVPEVDFISSSDASEATIPYDYSEMELMADSGSINEEVSENHDTEEVTQDHENEQNAKDIIEMNESTKENLEITEVVDILESPKKDDIVDAMELIHEEKLDSPEIIKLNDMATGLKQEQKKLAQERNKQDRMGTSITHNMERECKELLRLFGIPYVDSPMEAEAQCAFLNMIKLTDGTISDDSDIWLFGGQTVYKNFFVNKKMVMEFQYDSIEKMFNLDRKKLIQLAMLVGSDYTTGINGVGAVTALEILAAFPTTPVVTGETDEYQSMISSLRKFREWFNSGKPVGPCGKTVLKSKLKNIELFEGFPNLNVARAYLEPVIDDNKENFSWGLPDTESLVEFAKMKLGWTRLKTDEILEPVMKRLNEKKQTTMKDYFKSQVTKKFFDSGTMSKRVQKAVGIMAGNVSEDEEKKKEKAPKKRAIKTKKKAVEEKDGFKIPDEDQNIMLILRMSTGTRKTPRIPNTKQVIPQREKDKEEQEKAKQKAIQMFKKFQPSAVKKK
ncbi:unnamed protein product [Diamesa hyperborea]